MNKGNLASAVRSHYPKAFGIRDALAKRKKDSYSKNRRPIEEIRKAEEEGLKEDFVFSYWSDARLVEKVEKDIETILVNAPQYAERMDLDDVRIDMKFAYLAYGFLPDEYLCYDLEDKLFDERRSYISDSDRYEIVYGVNDIASMQTLLNKARAFKALRPYYHRDGLVITGRKELTAFKEFLQKHPEFVLKKPCASRGSGVSLVKLASADEKELLKSIKRFTAEGPCLIEERISQNGHVASLNKSSVNTIRCITLDGGDGPKVAFTFAKVGREGSFIDNGGAGGVLFGVDLDTGVGNTDGIDELNRTYTMHPDSQTQFKGFQFPRWDEMRALCIEMSSHFPELPYIGWDVACSDDGWVLVEGNMGQFIGPQVTAKRGIKEEVQQLLNRHLFD